MHSLARPVACVLLFAEGVFAQQPGLLTSRPTCAVAVPAQCALSGNPSGGLPMVQRRPADSASECAGLAEQAAASCAGPQRLEVRALFVDGALRTPVGREPARAGEPSGSEPLTLPITYGKQFQTEEDLLRYRPRYAPNVANLSNAGQLWVRQDPYVQVRLGDRTWSQFNLIEHARAAIEALPDVERFEWRVDRQYVYADMRISFDDQGRAYTLLQSGTTRLRTGAPQAIRRSYLLYRDLDASWRALPIALPDQRPSWRMRIEHMDDNSNRKVPPALLMYDNDADTGKRSGQLYLIAPRWSRGQLELGPLVRIAEDSLLQENHSGAANSVVSANGHVYVVYPSNRQPATGRGTDIKLVSFSRASASVETTSIATAGGAAAVDNHNVPGICVGTGDRIHVLLPGHQEGLQFLDGKVMGGGKLSWSQPTAIGEQPTAAGGYTYGSLNCNRAGQVMVSSRWAGDGYRFKLVILFRDKDDRWTLWGRRGHLTVVDPGRTYYGAWRQRVSTGPNGSWYLYYAYYANQLTEAEWGDIRGRHPFESWPADEPNAACFRTHPFRCFMHPLPEISSVLLYNPGIGKPWEFVQ